MTLLFGFANATIGGLFVLGWHIGGIFQLVPFLVAFLAIPLIDKAISRFVNPPPSTASVSRQTSEAHLALALGALSSLVALCHFVVGFGSLTNSDRLMQVLSMGVVFGSSLHVIAHEWIHSRSKKLKRFGEVLFALMGYPQFGLVHMPVHHAHVGLDSDPHTARLGEGYPLWLWRVWTSSWKNAWRRDRTLLMRLCTVSLLVLSSSLAVSPWSTLGILCAWVFGTVQLELANYVTHYGVRRNTNLASPELSWQCSDRLVNLFSFNIALHAEHHARPSASFASLRTRTDAPEMPHNLMAMFLMALIPPIWHRRMARRPTP